MANSKLLLQKCLYFTANSLARNITRIAEEEFRTCGLPPSHALLLMSINEQPGIGPIELSGKLKIAPSTVTRFIEPLESRGYLTRVSEGKNVKLFPTSKGEEIRDAIERSWSGLFDRYSSVLGKKNGETLTRMIDEAGKKLECI